MSCGEASEIGPSIQQRPAPIQVDWTEAKLLCSCHQGWRIHDVEPVVGEADDLLLAKDLQRPADVNVGKTESLADMALAQWQLYDLTRLGRKPAAYPHIDLEQETGDALPCPSQPVHRPR